MSRRLAPLPLILLALTVCAQDPKLIAVIPKEDEKVVLHNPDMGWVLYENYPLDPDKNGSSTLLTLPDEPFAAVDAVAIMFSWQDVERRPGEHEFSRADNEASTKTYDAFLRYSAFDHALKVPNVTFRRDGAGGAVHSNERKVIDHAFHTLQKGPMFSEFVDGYARSKKGRTGWVDWKIDDALSLHPNYVNLLGWQGGDARDFMTERPDLIDHALRTMGYRLVPTRIEYPVALRARQPFALKSEWTNRAVGRAMRDYTLRLTLTNDAGQLIATTDAGPTGCDRWIKGKTYLLTHNPVFANVVPGRYTLRFALIDPKTKQPIALPLTGADTERTYPAGTVDVRE